MNRFWLVWAHGGGPPTRAHKNLASAEVEASRLARLNPGQTFVVMESVLGKRRMPEIETLEVV